MARRTVYWHIGPDDPGTEFLGEALLTRRDELAEHGIAAPTGAWHEVEAQIWKHKGLSLLSTPACARADQDQVDLRLTGLRGVEVHLVVLVRDLPTQVHAAWQAGIQHGSTTPLTSYAERVLDPDRAHWQAEEFWTGRDLGTFLPRWAATIRPDRVHVVATPAGPDAIWEAFLHLVGIRDLPRPQRPVPRALAAETDPERVLDITTSWSKLLADRGFDLHGSLISSGLTPVPAGPGDVFDALTDLLTTTRAEADRLARETHRLRQENARLDRKHRLHKRRLAELIR
ncbi:MAG TPA: hypothetical protein VHO29_16235 [Marmoricola sp.]|nr:hypothetical protein [Marmoricola sp.]